MKSLVKHNMLKVVLDRAIICILLKWRDFFLGGGGELGKLLNMNCVF